LSDRSLNSVPNPQSSPRRMSSLTAVEGARKSEKMKIIADVKDPKHKSRRPYCDEWIRKLHGGSKGEGLKRFAVGKVYDDDLYALYAWAYGGGRDLEYQGIKVVVFKAPETTEDFENSATGYSEAGIR